MVPMPNSASKDLNPMQCTNTWLKFFRTAVCSQNQSHSSIFGREPSSVASSPARGQFLPKIGRMKAHAGLKGMPMHTAR